MTSPQLTDFWPTDGLRLRTPRLTLTPLREADFAVLVKAVLAGIHDPAVMPFAQPWTDQPPHELVRTSLKYWWSVRGSIAPQEWNLEWVVRAEGEVLGLQSLHANDFAVTRTVGTGSWLTQSAQGRGLGTEMRAAVLLFAVDTLGALRAETEAFFDNPASINVTTKLGYRPNGSSTLVRRPGEAAENQRFLLTPEDLRRPDWQLQVDGVTEEVLTLLGADPSRAPMI
ncbi:GNAT family N-acetyltransferase [Nakamurella sp. A5-74]|uniref:GNAT family N-acetyltransferase n=1 Tax=Nakamurella sp. A5-74 TaxID=3158264 RepID=A0AAU8DSH2_9ACTN